MATIPLTKGVETIVDEADIPHIAWYKWHLCNGYAARRSAGSRVYLHRELTGATGTQVVDHINGDRLDNRRSNLRIVSRLRNYRNSSLTPKGFSYYPRSPRKPWRAAYAGKTLGYFSTPEKARSAYVKARNLVGDVVK